MLFIGGAGGLADAARAIRQRQRDLNRRIELSNQRRRLRKLNREPVGDYEPERAEFHCAFLCGACDFFLPPRDDDNTMPACACPSCGESEWIDLGLEPAAGRIRDMEAEARMQAPPHIKRAVLFTSLSFFILVFSVCVLGEFFAPDYFSPSLVEGGIFFSLVGGVLLVPLLYYVAPRPLSVLWLKRQTRLPHRWHVPLPLPAPHAAPEKTLGEMSAQPLGETITAPVSGRECIAYEVCVLFDTPGDARPAEWVLQEQGGVALTLNGELELQPGSYYLESPVEPIDTPGLSLNGSISAAPSARYKAFKRFLRQRALFITDGDFHVYEACILPGDSVDVEAFEGPMYVLRHTNAPERGDLPRLPRPLFPGH
ncbi:hypothetical protein FRC96_02370 [Lujinxingia vulgaris]|uniref:Uncharacterized protein n=1 Tax=Lujinxingia vulgaris TaxID=2600176 RepID=A0A5C6XGE9_9DELT|nr:hypothetical protein [Lujinxingia vulgaris]TXD42752.1 hypothetical protein FRC96_02370 [Lujinxingia vulgaris]